MRPRRRGRSPGRSRSRSTSASRSIGTPRSPRGLGELRGRPRRAPGRRRSSASATWRSIRGPSDSSGPRSSSRSWRRARSASSSSRPATSITSARRRHERRDRHVVGQPVAGQLEQSLGLVDVLQPVLADVPEAQPVRVAPHERRASSPRRAPARRAASEQMRAARDDVETEVALVAERRLAGVDAHAHPQADAVRPRRASASPRCPVAAAATAFARPREHGEERVALAVHLAPARCGEGLAHDPVVLREDAAPPVAELLQQPRRALDVGEEEGDGAARELAARR